ITVSLVSQTNEICNGGNNGSFTVSAAGGSSGSYFYSTNGTGYQSSPTFSGLTAGVYNVYVTNGAGCSAVLATPVTITQPTALSLGLAETDATTYGGSDGTVTATFSGGTPPYALQFNGGGYNAATSPHNFTGLTAGSYTVDLKDTNGCMSSQILSVSQPRCSGA